MDKIKDLMDKRIKLIHDAKTFMEKEAPTAEDHEKFTTMMNESDNYKKQADALVTLAKANKEIEDFNAQAVENSKIYSSKANKENAKPYEAEDYRTSFHKGLTARDMKMLAPEVRTVLATSPGADGGFLIPKELDKTIIKKMELFNELRSISRVLSLTTDKDIPVEATRSVASIIGENAPYPESQSSWGQKSLKSFKWGYIFKASIEFLADQQVNFEEFIADVNARAFGIPEEAMMLNGTGVAQPLGILATAGLNNQAAAAAAVIAIDDMIKLEAALPRPYRKMAKFMMHDTTKTALRLLKDLNGQYYLQPSLVAGVPDTFSGYEIRISSAMPAIATGVKSVLFGDFSYFWIGDRAGQSTLQRLEELYRANGQIGYISDRRSDSVVTLPEAFATLTHP